jgi:hypothetical protein
MVSLFTENVRIYETNNRGRLYDFCFVIGVSGAFGGTGSQTNAPRVVGWPLAPGCERIVKTRRASVAG